VSESDDVRDLVARLADALRPRRAMLATAESCTGGLVAAACTSLAGSSDWFEGGVVSYSNAAKSELLGVAPALIDRHGAVSAEVARAMAEGLLARVPASFAVAVTGIAGPGGGSIASRWARSGSRPLRDPARARRHCCKRAAIARQSATGRSSAPSSRCLHGSR